MSSILIASFLMPTIGLAFLLWFALYNPLFDKFQTRLFLVAISINILAMLASYIDYSTTLSTNPNIYILRRITSFFNFSLSPVLPLLLLLIFSRKREKWWIYVPIGLNTLLCFISIFVNVIFFINNTNNYNRGFLFVVPFMITIFYILMILKYGISHKNKRNSLRERLMLLFAILLISICMILEIFFYFKFLVWGASAISLVAYYTLLNIHCFSFDPLTNLYNRLMYNKLIENIKNNKAYCFALIDINNFKEVNDTLGHLAGDHYLQALAKLLHQVFGRTANLYRIGGDEFMVVSKSLNIIKFTQTIEKLKDEAEKNNMSFAVGLSEIKESDNVHEMLLQIDKLMYQDKANYKLAIKN